MDENNDYDKVDEVIMPGFRFHPTDEELVGFYLKMKIQHRSLPIELIKQVDIYKYDPWDLPKLATMGEKEWYFYCPRDRKYRNSVRPNRVTKAGFWKATGTDRPIYSSESTKCIGLKKSLVFYKGRAAKGTKTDWMMHEFRLPSLTNSAPLKRPMDKNLPPNDSWAICRIFKKTNSMAHRDLSHSWVSPLPESTRPDMVTHGTQFTPFSSENNSCTTKARSAIELCCNNDFQHSSNASFSLVNPMDCKPSMPFVPNGDLPANFMFSPFDVSGPAKCTVDVASLIVNLSPALLGDISKVSESIDFSVAQQQCNSFSMMQGNMGNGEEETCLRKNSNISHVNNQWGTFRSVGFPFNLPPDMPDVGKPSLPWDSPPYPSDMSPNYSTNKSYT